MQTIFLLSVNVRESNHVNDVQYYNMISSVNCESSWLCFMFCTPIEAALSKVLHSLFYLLILP